MSVNDVLDKITERNGSLIGCIAKKGERTYHNLEAFDMDCDRITETITDLLAVSDMLGEGDEPVTTVLAEYDGNCLVGQRIDDSLLVVVSDHLQRGGYKKLQVGLSLQARLLTKALDEEAAIPAPSAPKAQTAVSDTGETGSKWSKLLKSVVAQAPEMPAEVPADTKGKVKRYYRGQVYYD